MSPEPRSNGDLAAAVKAMALEEGFVAAGVAPAAGEPPHAGRFAQWLSQGWHGEMAYLERALDVRLGTRPIFEGARSILCLAASYDSSGAMLPSSEAWGREGMPANPPAAASIARYARGRDYHKVLKAACRRLIERLRGLAPRLETKAFVDSGLLGERTLAAWSGVGWIGRNGCLLVPGVGSYVVLCEIATNLPLAPDGPLAPDAPLDVAGGSSGKGGCGDCRACVDVCPGGAIQRDSLIDARRCLSYLTIECRGEFPRELREAAGGRLFGCDRCQEVCPHNQDAVVGRNREATTETPAVASNDAANHGTRHSALGGATLADILLWTPEDWDGATRGSACRRATWEMFLRNACVAAGSSGDASLVGALDRAAAACPAAAEAAAWAAQRLRKGRV